MFWMCIRIASVIIQLYVRWKSLISFVRSCFCDEENGWRKPKCEKQVQFWGKGTKLFPFPYFHMQQSTNFLPCLFSFYQSQNKLPLSHKLWKILIRITCLCKLQYSYTPLLYNKTGEYYLGRRLIGELIVYSSSDVRRSAFTISNNLLL